MASQLQIVRRGEERWEVTRVERRDGMFFYETVARVLRDEAFYYVEFVVWGDEGHTWKREPRGYLLPEPAFKVAAKGPPPKEVH